MKRKVSTLEVRHNLGEILDRVALRHDEFLIQRRGKSLAALVPVERLEQMEEAARLHLLDILSSIRSSVSTEDADALALEAQRAVRRKTRSSR